jgi:hypothetical protein
MMAAALDVIALAGIVVLGLGFVRAIQMARAFVNRAYRSRAYWAALLMLTIVVGNFSGFISFPEGTLGRALSYVPFIVLLLVLLVFVDRVIRVAMEGDFFHRDILRWRTVGKATYPALVVSMAISASTSYQVIGSSAPAPSALVLAAYFQLVVVIPLVFGYSVAALIIGGRRTPDRVMKRHIRLLGYGLLCFVVGFPFFSGGPLENLFGNLMTLFADLFLYFSVMSLSLLGRVEKMGEIANQPSPQGAPGRPL